MAQVRDKLWLWAHQEGSHNDTYDLPGASAMTPAQAVPYMDLQNVIMVRYGQEPYDATAYAESLRGAQRVVWSIVGEAGRNDGTDLTQMREMAARYPNWCGVMMDDFFYSSDRDPAAAFSVDDIISVQNQLAIDERKLDLWVVLYEHQLGMPIHKHLENCDVVTYWTWEAPKLARLEEDFLRVEELTPACRKVLGCYLFDYGTNKPMPIDMMKHQCEVGLRWLREGRIEGMIFLASCICDLDLEAVKWTRDWIQKVGAECLPDSQEESAKPLAL